MAGGEGGTFVIDHYSVYIAKENCRESRLIVAWC